MGEVEGEVRNEQLDAEREARRRAALAQVRQYPDPVLRLKARPVEDFDESLATLVQRMTSLMQEARGVGLAATQVGVLRRVLVYQTSEDEPVRALVNPQISASSDERLTQEEGCLSLRAATVIVPVERAHAVTIEAVSPDGDPLLVEAEGLDARVIQHEIDHLDGKLIVDRAAPEDRREALAKLRPQPLLAPLA